MSTSQPFYGSSDKQKIINISLESELKQVRLHVCKAFNRPVTILNGQVLIATAANWIRQLIINQFIINFNFCSNFKTIYSNYNSKYSNNSRMD